MIYVDDMNNRGSSVINCSCIVFKLSQFLVIVVMSRSRPDPKRNRRPSKFHQIQKGVMKAREEQRIEFNSIIDDVNKFVYSNMTSTRKERALKKRFEEKRAEALGCTPEKGVNHSYNHLKNMRQAKARKREELAEKARVGEDVDTRSALYRDVGEIKSLRKRLRREKRDRKQSRGMLGEGLDKSVKFLVKKFS